MERSDIIAFVMAISLIALVLLGVNELNKAKCEAKSESFNDHKYSFISGCMVEHNDRWLPLDNIRGFE